MPWFRMLCLICNHEWDALNEDASEKCSWCNSNHTKVLETKEDYYGGEL
jgi:hypothetical protein